MWKSILLFSIIVAAIFSVQCFSEKELTGLIYIDPIPKNISLVFSTDPCINDYLISPQLITATDTFDLNGQLKEGNVTCRRKMCDTVRCSIFENGKKYKIRGHFHTLKDTLLGGPSTFIVTSYKLLLN